MTKKKFKEGLKLLYRFLKEEGQYKPVLDFLFRDGKRPINNLFNEFNSKKYNVDDWALLFMRINLLADEFNYFDNYRYRNVIDGTGINKRWIYYYRQHQTTVENE